MIELGAVVQSLAGRDGVEAVLLLSGDGLPIEHAARGAFDSETVAALAATLAQHAGAARPGRGARGELVTAVLEYARRAAGAGARGHGRLARDPRRRRRRHRSPALRSAPASPGAGRAALMRWAVLLAGGSGTRFWPLSTPAHPEAAAPALRRRLDRGGGGRAADRPDPARAHPGRGRRGARRPAARRCSSLPAENFLVEPRAASTAPALIWATWEARRRDPDAEVLSLHADWAVGDAAAFRRTADARAHDRADATTGW